MTYTVKIGNTSDIWIIGVKGVTTLDSNWTGRKVVTSLDGDTTYIDTAMIKNSGSTKFLGFLTPTETTALDEGTYNLTFEVSNTTLTTPIVREETYIIEVVEGV